MVDGIFVNYKISFCFDFSNIVLSFSLKYLFSWMNASSFDLVVRLKNRLNSSDGLKSLSMDIFLNRYKPSCVRTLDRTTYSQFLKNPPGHDVIMTMSLDIPCSLCPVVASLQFTGNCVILHVISVGVVARGCASTDTFVVSVLGVSWNV